MPTPGSRLKATMPNLRTVSGAMTLNEVTRVVERMLLEGYYQFTDKRMIGRINKQTVQQNFIVEPKEYTVELWCEEPATVRVEVSPGVFQDQVNFVFSDAEWGIARGEIGQILIINNVSPNYITVRRTVQTLFRGQLTPIQRVRVGNSVDVTSSVPSWPANGWTMAPGGTLCVRWYESPPPPAADTSCWIQWGGIATVIL